MTAKRVPLAALRARLRDAGPGPALEALIQELDADPRAGARALLERAHRIEEAERREQARLRGLLAQRDALFQRGVRAVAGVDEVGVGPLAGPVVAAAVVLPDEIELRGLDDSKKLRPEVRTRLAAAIRESARGVGIGEVSAAEIDRMGIHRAGLEAMRRAVLALEAVLPLEHLLVDARTVPGGNWAQTAIVRGDEKDASIAAASIVAKVHRDRWLEELARRHPGYGFERHRGYGTEAHLDALQRLGPCAEHRRSFAPVAAAERRFAAVGRAASAIPAG